MTDLNGKHLLVVGDETPLIHDLEEVLQSKGVTIHTAACDQVTLESVKEQHVDIVLLNHLQSPEACIALLSRLRSDRMHDVLPIFALVENTEEKIQGALMLGAADYFTSDESVDNVLGKFESVLGASSPAVKSSIDITPKDVQTTGKTANVYLVEDDELLRNLLTMRFAKANFKLRSSSDGVDAVEEMRMDKPDILILDLMLPGKSGFEVLEKMRATPGLENVPVIVFSNRDGQADRAKAKELGAEHFYVKAMTDLSDLVKTVQLHVG